MTADEEIRIGDRAALLLKDEVLNLVFSDLEQDCARQWRNSPARDVEGREKIWQLVKQLDCIRAELRKRADAGNLAKISLEREQKAREFEKEHGFRPPI